MSDSDERAVHDLTVRIDRALCVGFAQCVDESDEAFGLGEDDHVAFESPERVARDCLIRACRACPVGALSVLDREGRQLVP